MASEASNSISARRFCLRPAAVSFGATGSALPPLLVVLLESPGVAVWTLVILFAFQFVIVNVLMPRLLSEAVGLHPLLVFAAILFSVKIAGFWGAFFGIPVAGVLWAMGKFFFDEWRKDNPSGNSQSADQGMD